MSVDSYIQVPPDGSGKKIRAIQETNLSGDVVYSKVVKISGESVVVTSGVVVGKVSGETVTVASGPFVMAKVSGENVVITSGTVSLVSGGFVRAATSGDVASVVSGSVKVHSGIVALYSGGFVSALVSGTVIGKVSGEIVSVGGYSKDIVSGAVIRNVMSGACVLHTVVITDRTSGYYMRIRDAMSGAMGTIIAMPYAQSRSVEPSTLIFDCIMTSGIVVDTSGATWHATVTYRK